VINVILFDGEAMPGLLSQSYPHARQDDIYRFAAALFDTAFSYDIFRPLRLAHWLAQVGHESGELRYVEELASGRAYEGRKDLGNTQPGDGVRFKGRGLIQLTGRHNYTKYTKAIGQELEPQQLAELPWCVDSAGWFWTQGSGMNLNDLADRDNALVITRRINGGLNGLSHRMDLLKRTKKAIDYLNTLELQRRLNKSKRWPELVEDGLFGPRTASVLREMQADYFLKPTGEVDNKTKQRLLSFV
jgi:putative chitinase